MKQTIENLVVDALGEMGLDLPAGKAGVPAFVVEHPADLALGDYSTNVAMVLGKRLGKNPRELAEEISKSVDAVRPQNGEIKKIEVAGAGFINFYLTKEFFKRSIGEIIDKGESFGRNESLKREKVMVEYTDPNAMKPFHIGHLMSNAIGEALSRIVEWNGADVVRANYYSDTGLGIAKAVWGMTQMRKETPDADASVILRTKYLGKAYAFGVAQAEADENVANETKAINKKIFERSDQSINELYDMGKAWSLEHFTELYKKLGSSFDWIIGESEVADDGLKIVKEFLNKGTFEESEGAVVFKAEKFNPKLHTRVFISREGLPTYEAKELGLTQKKFEKYNPSRSIVITANEQNEYFKVVLEAMCQTFPELAKKTEHLSHGMLRLPTGKMSSRTGDVITAEELIEEVKKRTMNNEQVAIGAIKYMILRQSIGNDIIFDLEKSVSTEGDSGVYLQYAYARTNSLLEKAGDLGPLPTLPLAGEGRIRLIERLLYRFPEVVGRAHVDRAPNYIATYLTELAGAYNNFYAQEQVISEDPEAPYRLALTKAFNTVMRNGLSILGIPALDRI